MMTDRRLRLLTLLAVLLFGAAWARAAELTTVGSGEIKAKLGEGRQPQIVAAPRGTVTDRKGYALAISEPASDVAVTPYMIDDPAALADRLAPLLGVDAAELAPKLSGRGLYSLIARRLPQRQARKVAALKIPGLSLTPTTRRIYPFETVASQILGFSGTDGQGLAGVELSLDGALKGQNGKRLLVRGRGADGPVVYVKEERQARPGKSVKLTLDRNIQSRAEDDLAQYGTQFGAESATAVVMQPSTGHVLAMASWPRVDANDPLDAPDSARRIMGVGFPYEPGSTFKPFTVAGALESRVITPNSSFQVGDSIQVADQEIKEAHPHGTVAMTPADILAYSSNVGTIQIARDRLGERRFDDWMRRFGFGSTTGIELPGEEPGVQPSLSSYSGSSIGNLPIGQGELVTPLQLTAGYATLANDGVRVAPTLVAAVEGKEPTRRPGQRVVSATTAAQVRDMLTRVTEAGGTGEDLAIPGYSIAGKTGTAQHVDPVTKRYSHSLYTASFVGMAPAKNPRVVVAVIIDKPRAGGEYTGAQVAGPAFRQLMRWTLTYLAVPPDRPTTPQP